jgi:hypothetical protein
VSVSFEASAFSPDGNTLAVAASTQAVRLVDLRRMRLAGRGIELGRTSYVDTMQWLDARTIAAVTWGAPPRLLTIDVRTRRVVARRDLPGNVFARARTRDGLVLLVGPNDRIGPSTLVVVDRGRGVRRAVLREIESGFETIRDGEHRRVSPGLAVDPTGRRAVVVPPAGRVAEIDLRSLTSSYHELSRHVSLLGRLRDWLEPSAFAKSVAGPERHAFWVGRDTVAVVAIEHVGIGVKDGENRQLARARGVQLIDTSSWRTRTLSERAGGVAVAAETALVYGGPFSSGASFSADDGTPVTGLQAFTSEGKERFGLFPSRRVGFVQTAGRYAYVTGSGSPDTAVVDVAAGVLVGTARTPEPLFVLATP